jgi:putative transposase
MSQSLVKNLIPLVYSTKHRSQWIPKDVSADLYAYQAGIYQEWESPAFVIGGRRSRSRFVLAIEELCTD